MGDSDRTTSARIVALHCVACYPSPVLDETRITYADEPALTPDGVETIARCSVCGAPYVPKHSNNPTPQGPTTNQTTKPISHFVLTTTPPHASINDNEVQLQLEQQKRKRKQTPQTPKGPTDAKVNNQTAGGKLISQNRID